MKSIGDQNFSLINLYYYLDKKTGLTSELPYCVGHQCITAPDIHHSINDHRE